jgi:hypothetical protein
VATRGVRTPFVLLIRFDEKMMFVSFAFPSVLMMMLEYRRIEFWLLPPPLRGEARRIVNMTTPHGQLVCDLVNDDDSYGRGAPETPAA